jgi:REP element-mobilizing transposase RayT
MTTQRQQLATYALTISTFQQHRHFQRTANAELFLATLQRYRTQRKFLLHAYAVMPDHVHILLTPASDRKPSAQPSQSSSSKAATPTLLAH